MSEVKCFVTDCCNTSENKRLVRVPAEPNVRHIWLEKCLKLRPKTKFIDNATPLFCCEDHFDLSEDTTTEWLEGDQYTNCFIEVKPEVVPHKLIPIPAKKLKLKRKKSHENHQYENKDGTNDENEEYEIEIIEGSNGNDTRSENDKNIDTLLKEVGLSEDRSGKMKIEGSEAVDDKGKSGKKKKRKVIKEILAWIPAPNATGVPDELKTPDGKSNPIIVVSNPPPGALAGTPGNTASGTPGSITSSQSNTPSLVLPNAQQGGAVPNVATLPLKKDKITQFIITVPETQGGGPPKLPLLAIPEGYTYTIDKMANTTQIITEIEGETIISLHCSNENQNKTIDLIGENRTPRKLRGPRCRFRTPELPREKIKDINLSTSLKYVLNEFRSMKRTCDSLSKQVNKLRVENGKLRNQIAARIKEGSSVKVVQKEVKVVQRELVEANPDKSKKMEYAAEELKKIFSPNQVRVLFDDKARVQWTNEEITNAYSIYNVSAQAYKILHDDLKYPFPSITTLKRYHEKFELQDRLSTADQFDSEEEVQRDENAIRMALGQQQLQRQPIQPTKTFNTYEPPKPPPKIIGMKNIQNASKKMPPQKQMERPKFGITAPTLTYPRHPYIPNYQPYTDNSKQINQAVRTEPINMGVQPIQSSVQQVQPHENIMYEEVIIHCDNNDIYQTYRPNSYL